MTKTIVFLENGTSGGGSFEGLVQIVAHLDRARFRPIVAFVNRTVHAERCRQAGIETVLLRDPLYTLPPRLWARVFLRCARMIERLHPRWGSVLEDAVHAPTRRALAALCRDRSVALVHCNNQSVRDFYGIALAHRLHIPCVSMLRSARVHRINPQLLFRLNTMVAQFVAPSVSAKKHWVALGIRTEKIAVVPNAVDASLVTPTDLHGRWNIDPTAHVVIGCVGTLGEGKGHVFLLHAFAAFHREDPRALLLLIGDGPLRSTLEQAARTLRITDAVRFVGYDPDARATIAALHLLVVPSATETFGRVLLEAMVVGTPVVATRVGGIPEIVHDGMNGLLVPFDDAGALTRAMQRMVRDASLRMQCIAGGQQTVHERFAIAPHVRTMEDIYDRVCS